MTANATDRRVPRTRSMLQDALMSLILSKSYDAITVADICNAANVGRSTFYAHYRSKDDLKRSGLDRLQRLLVDRQADAEATRGRAEDRILSFSLALFEHARDHLTTYRALAGSRGRTVALDAIRAMLAKLVREELRVTAEMNSADAMQRELIVEYLVGAYLAVLTWWLDGDIKLPPQRVDAMFRRLATEGIAAANP